MRKMKNVLSFDFHVFDMKSINKCNGAKHKNKFKHLVISSSPIFALEIVHAAK